MNESPRESIANEISSLTPAQQVEVVALFNRDVNVLKHINQESVFLPVVALGELY